MFSSCLKTNKQQQQQNRKPDKVYEIGFLGIGQQAAQNCEKIKKY